MAADILTVIRQLNFNKWSLHLETTSFISQFNRLFQPSRRIFKILTLSRADIRLYLLTILLVHVNNVESSHCLFYLNMLADTNYYIFEYPTTLPDKTRLLNYLITSGFPLPTQASCIFHSLDPALCASSSICFDL